MNTLKRGIEWWIYLMFDSEVSPILLGSTLALLVALALYLLAISNPELVRNSLKEILATPTP